MPQFEYPGLVKVCNDEGIPVDPDKRDEVDSKERGKVVKSVLKKYFNNDVDCAIEESCMYTLTPDYNHVMDKHPTYNNVVIGAGFSGGGFKLAPVTGEILAKMTIGEGQKYDLDELGPF